MKNRKRWCRLGTAAVLLAGMLLSGCARSADYTEEIREYQTKLESLAAENEELKAMLGMESETVQETQAPEQEQETAPETQSPETGTVSENAGAQETPPADEDVMRVLVLGDSIWDSTRDETGVAAKVEAYAQKAGQKVEVYNAAIGGTRATINKDESPYEFGPGSECSLPKMVSILVGESDVEWLQGKKAYEEMKVALAVKDQLDMVILSYGLNDFLMRVPINCSKEDGYWRGYGSSLREEIREIKNNLPNVKIMVAAPTFAYYFSIPVENYGERALYNYVTEACVVAQAENVLCINPYDELGINAYNEEEYLEDGVHLSEKGRDLYARGVVNCMLYGTPGTVSGNAIEFED